VPPRVLLANNINSFATGFFLGVFCRPVLEKVPETVYILPAKKQ